MTIHKREHNGKEYEYEYSHKTIIIDEEHDDWIDQKDSFNLSSVVRDRLDELMEQEE